MNNFEGWKHINSAPKDKEILVWDGYYRNVAEFNGELWVVSHSFPVYPTHWRGCPSPPSEALPDDPDNQE